MASAGWKGAIALVALGLTCSSCALLEELPTLTDADLSRAFPQTSIVYDARGRVITTFHGVEDRTVIPLEQVPEHVRNAVLAIEDRRFYEHGGVDLQAVVRAAVENVRSGEVLQGGSTITQQYVKNRIIALSGNGAEKTLKRKIDEAALARQLEARLTKDEILERYLNTVYFGNGAYGVQAAAKVYFGVPARRLTLVQGALLAGLIRSPEGYDPYDEPQLARARRAVVLDAMASLGMISGDRAERAARRPLGVRRISPRREQRYQAPYFVDYVRRLLLYDERFSFLGDDPEERDRKLLEGGLRIHTTLDLDAQHAAERAIASVLYEPADPHAALVAIEPATGAVRAMVGGRDWFAKRKQDPFAKLNLAIAGAPGLGRTWAGGEPVRRAPGTGRQAGSAFKPFALVAALKAGIPLSAVLPGSACKTFPIGGSAPWEVCNYGGASYGRVTLLEATIRSINVAYASLIVHLGAEAVVDVAKRMGIRSPLKPVPSGVLGTNEVNALDMASAFATLATNGQRHAPVAIARIVSPTGEVLYEDRSKPKQVLEPGIAYLATTALEGVISSGTGTAANIGRPAAGKTGTAQEYRDAWFAGYTPDLSAAVWVGYPDGLIEMKTSCGAAPPSKCRPTRITVAGGTWPAQIWRAFMVEALAGVPPRDFERPAVIPSLSCATAGLRALDGNEAKVRPQLSPSPGEERNDPVRGLLGCPDPKEGKGKGKGKGGGKDGKAGDAGGGGGPGGGGPGGGGKPPPPSPKPLPSPRPSPEPEPEPSPSAPPSPQPSPRPTAEPTAPP